MGKSKKSKKDKRRSDSDSDEWVETPRTSKETIIDKAGPIKLEGMDDSNWNAVFSRTLVSKEKKNKEREDQPILDKPGQHPRELNPYWKSGGTGLPEESKTTEKRPLAGTSDAGLQWLLRAKKRLVEQSEETGASVEQLAIERWGSLANLNRKITEAEELSSFKAKRPSFRKPDHREEPRSRKRSSTRSRSRSPRRRRRTRSRSDDEEYTRSRSKSRERDRWPKDKKSESKMKEVSHVSDKVSDPQIKRTPSWMKKQEKESEIASETTRQAVPALGEEHKQETSSIVGLYMTEEEMNKLAAKILKAELMGRTTEAAEMKEKLEAARKSKETVILTRTDVRGMTRPLEKPQDSKGVPSRSKKVPTHQDKQRIRYFGDDEKYSLREMFEREKLGTAEDQNMMFARLAGKVSHFFHFSVEEK
ncbi:CWF19-like protein 2 [Artemia franciscana]|uniref:CWF19-like protein 2 n=1 Tax=Artemia franciscana TaxID=6661 RepID=UPI0032DA172B